MPLDAAPPSRIIEVYRRRASVIERLRARPELLPQLKLYYRDHPADFINDFGVTFDPRNPMRGLPTAVPFLLFPRQRAWLEWIMERWQAGEDGLTEKSRDMGVSWLAVSLSVTLCLFRSGLSIGFGSRTEDDVDKSGDPDSLFWKAREFIRYLPTEFRAGFDFKRTTSHLLLQFPETDSVIKGDAGDNIGRGGRSSLYFVDEAAHLQRPAAVDAALSQTTNCRLDVSTPRGLANSFAFKRFSWPSHRIFTFHWRDDPRKDDAWYKVQQERLDPTTLAQEVDLDYAASIEGVLIPSAWVQAAVGAHLKLNYTPTGQKAGALDVADEGRDLNAYIGVHGNLVNVAEEWSGAGADIYATTQRAFNICDRVGQTSFRYDADGLGAGVRGDARVINEGRGQAPKIVVEGFRGSEAPFAPESEDVKGRKNKDFFANRKAQAWWGLRTRFQKTYKAVAEGITSVPDELISLDPNLPHLQKLCGELSQPTYMLSVLGKVMVNKVPEGLKSPNLADATMIRFAPMTLPVMHISDEMLRRAGQRV